MLGGEWKVCIGGGGGVRDLDGVIVEYAIGLLIRRDVVGLFRRLLEGCGGRCRGGDVGDIIFLQGKGEIDFCNFIAQLRGNSCIDGL